MSPDHAATVAVLGRGDRRPANPLVTPAAPGTVGGRAHSDGMTWIAPPVNRVPEPGLGDERESLERWLAYHRQTLLMKCAGLSAAQLASRPVSPSALSLHGLVRHLAEVEREWLRRCVAGQDVPYLYCSDDNIDGDFDDVDDADAATDLAAFARECALADEAAAGRPLDARFIHETSGVELDLRWVYLHLIEEYARHNGHADLLREHIDGATGD
jgi:uncharacterized damage-inducible protein DinB